MLHKVPISAQVMALVVFVTVLTAGAMAAIALLGPPPRQSPLPLGEMVDILEGEVTPPDHMQLVVSQQPSQPPAGWIRRKSLENEAARMTGVPLDRLRLWTGPDASLHGDILFGQVQMSLRRDNGQYAEVSALRDDATRQWQVVTLSTMGGVLVVVLLLAWGASRRITRPIQELAEAARSSRAGAPWGLPVPAGPPEVAEAAQALDDLQHRNHEHARQQMTMLAAIAHDIGTPLARLAFRADSLPVKGRDGVMRDIEIIRHLLGDALTLGRSWAGAYERIDMAALCRRLAQNEDGFRGDVRLIDSPAGIEVEGNAFSLERMVQNLIDNALRYGGNARLAIARDGQRAVLTVEDDGPGFPDMPQSELLQPFVRGESSRNTSSGGSGLGLAIVAQIVAQYGGTITLENPPAGGARVTVILPLA